MTADSILAVCFRMESSGECEATKVRTLASLATTKIRTTSISFLLLRRRWKDKGLRVDSSDCGTRQRLVAGTTPQGLNTSRVTLRRLWTHVSSDLVVAFASLLVTPQ